MSAWGWAVHTMTSRHVGGGHRTTFGGWLSLKLGSRGRTQVVRLVWQRPYPLSHLTGLSYALRTELRFGKLASRMQLRRSHDACLYQLGESTGLAAALESLLSPGSPVLRWFALGWQWFALFSHLSTHLSQ